jgi:Flp pilus assembly protein TadD
MAEHEDVKKRLADERAAREKTQAEQREAQSAVKPTPTQAENDLAASGEHVIEHEHDGSPVEGEPHVKRQAEANKPAAGRGDYSTRAMEQPKSTTPAHEHEPKAKP